MTVWSSLMQFEASQLGNPDRSTVWLNQDWWLSLYLPVLELRCTGLLQQCLKALKQPGGVVAAHFQWHWMVTYSFVDDIPLVMHSQI